MNFELLKRYAQITIPLGIFVLTVMIIYVLLSNSPKAKQQPVINRIPLVEAIKVTREDVSIPVHTRGLVAAQTEVALVSQVSGIVLEVANDFHNGGFFKKGDTLIKIDPASYLLEITKKQLAVDAAIVQLEEVTAKAHVARKGAKKDATDYAMYIPQIRRAKSQLAAANADLELARIRLSNTEITAPFDGRFKKVNVTKDQYINPGESLAEVYSLDVAEIRLPISDHHLSLIDIPARFQDETESKTKLPAVKFSSIIGDKIHHWRGQVVRSEGGLDENRLLYVVAEVDTPFLRDKKNLQRPPLEIGRFVEAEISGRQQESVVVLPRGALRGQQDVWLVDDYDRLFSRSVDVLYRGRDQIYVRGGLQNGERVVLTPLDFAVDGMRVRFAMNDSGKKAL